MVVLEEDSEEPYTCLLPQGFAQLESWKEMGMGITKSCLDINFLATAFFFSDFQFVHLPNLMALLLSLRLSVDII